MLYTVIYQCSLFIADIFYRQKLVALTHISSLEMIKGTLKLVQQTHLSPEWQREKIEYKLINNRKLS